MLTVFFTSNTLLPLDALPKGQKDDHDYFIQKVIPELQSKRSRFARPKTPVEFVAHMDSLISHNDTRMTNALGKANVIRGSHPVYSLDMSSCGFWLFEMLKHEITDRQLQSPKEILDAITEL
jgi:hypothetical protein